MKFFRTTEHIVSFRRNCHGCYRLHPVEWNIGESAGLLAAFCLQNKVYPRQVAERGEVLGEFQKLLTDQKIELEWPSFV